MPEPQEPTPVEPQEPPVQGTAEPQQQAEPQEPPVAQEPKSEPTEPQEPAPEPKKYVLKVDGEDIEKTEEEIQELARQGLKFTHKMQQLSEYEKQVQTQVQLAKAVQADPTYAKAQIARQMGYQDPSFLFSNPQPPPEWLKEQNPQQYYEHLSYYNEMLRAKVVVDTAYTNYMGAAAQGANSTLFSQVALEKGLDENQKNELASFIQTNFRPDATGMYSKEIAESAYWAKFGRDAGAKAKIQNTNNIQKTIKKAASANTSTSTRPPQPTKSVLGQDFMELVRSESGRT